MIRLPPGRVGRIVPPLLALAGGALALLVLGRGGVERHGAELAPPPAAGSGERRPADPDAAPAPARDAVTDRGASPAPVEAAAPTRTFRATGVAVDLDGLPAAGIPLACAADGPEAAAREPRGTTAGDGSFALELPRAITAVVSADPGWTVLAGGGFRHGDPPLRVVVAPAIAWSGTVVSADGGAPLPGARVRAVPPAGAALAALPRPPVAETAAGPDGRFALGGVAAVPGARVEVAADGHVLHVAEPGAAATELGVIALEPGRAPAARGVVRLPDGRPAAGARVRIGAAQTAAGDDGTFELRLDPPEPGAALIATLPEHAPARVDGIGDRLLAGDADGLELVLRAGGLAIAGRVVDAEGTPLKRWTVEILTADGDAAGPAQRTRKDGAFELGELAPGSYTAVARGREPDEIVVATDVAAPRAGLELRASGPARELTGRVLRADGAPAAGARVELVAAGAFRASPLATLAGADGRFALAGVPATAGWLRALPARDGDGLPARAAVEPHAQTQVELRLEPANPVRFEAADPRGAPDALFAVGAGGRPREIWSGGFAHAVVALDAGRSGLLALPRDALELVLTRGGREVGRVAVPPAGAGPDAAAALVRWE